MLTGYLVPGVALDLTIAKSTVDVLAEFCDRPVSIYREVICALQASEDQLVNSEIDSYRLAVHKSHYGGIEQRWLVVESQSRREADQGVIDRETRCAGRFVLATNVLDIRQLSHDQMLLEYKAQQSLVRLITKSIFAICN